ncbi:DUF6542 domain-containing protein [Corynebacterium jeikeium]|uniref:DUF6542 domain-containing protein n=1 Tax=Corynebacterium jeikeium TaxID=38289 RepID=UPI000553DCF7|nr:DUF6542 domain-containing protein [Corynebacterium jeikeium]OOD29360.1 hypothetical protein BWP03_10430 [Corynebacterium jeikeium]WCZ54057.1 hypothetical protein CJEIK_07800 [Corynebacterium jeikeium]SQI20422.1 gamma-aminobutyrate permease or related permease [Corynebacterium jeikeium]SUY80637.1 gamma-aminobutyrate permease or related permease [Corynebacterium jeikeium]
MTESSRHRSNNRSVHRGVRSRGKAEVAHDDSPAHWFPVWAPVLVMLAIVFTGLVLANGDTTIPTLFFGLFAVGMIASTIFVEPRGLFITVASFPLFYLFGSLLIGWFSSGRATIASRKTKVITSIYPAIEHYLWLLIPFLVAVGIAVFRWWNFRESLTRKAAKLEMQRRRRSESDRSNIETYGRAQERSHARSHARRSARSFNDAPSYEPRKRSERTAQRGTRIPRGGDSVPAPYQERAARSLDRDSDRSIDRDEEFLRLGETSSADNSRTSAKRVTRSSEELRENAQRRRIPFPERRMSPKRYLDDERE